MPLDLARAKDVLIEQDKPKARIPLIKKRPGQVDIHSSGRPQLIQVPAPIVIHQYQHTSQTPQDYHFVGRGTSSEGGMRPTAQGSSGRSVTT